MKDGDGVYEERLAYGILPNSFVSILPKSPCSAVWMRQWVAA